MLVSNSSHCLTIVSWENRCICSIGQPSEYLSISILKSWLVLLTIIIFQSPGRGGPSTSQLLIKIANKISNIYFLAYRSFCRLRHGHIPDKHRWCGHFKSLKCKIYFWKCSIGHFAGWHLQTYPIHSNFACISKSLKSTFQWIKKVSQLPLSDNKEKRCA